MSAEVSEAIVAPRAVNALSPGSPTDGRRIRWAQRRIAGEAGVGRPARLLGVLVAVLFVVGIWSIASALGIWSQIILPSPAKVWRAFVQSVTVHDGQRGLSGYFLWQHLWASLLRIIKGVTWAFVFGLPLGLALGTSRRFELFAAPIVSFLRSLPPLGYFSLLIIWFGIDDTSKVWLLFIAAFPPVALSVAAGVASVRTERISAGLVLGANRVQLLRHTIFPSILPELFTGMRVAIGFAWTTIVAAETSNGLPGIGGLAWATKKELRSDIAIMCVVVIGITAVLMDAGMRKAERCCVPWKGRA
jgi:taurine transport system permease protein